MRRDVKNAIADDEIIVDLFAGGGGASLGIEMALGRPVDVAINHDPAAILMHKKNHPHTLHLTESVWDADPARVAAGRKVGLLWLSPDCKHFSKAKGGRPADKSIRSLAWAGVRWAAMVHPRIIILENVEEFQTWCRLGLDGKPDMRYKGETFRSFVYQLERLGYCVEWRELRACDYGAPTIRKRFVLIARNDGKKIAWPQATHGEPSSEAVVNGKLKPWRSAAEVVDFFIPCPSVFATKEQIVQEYGLNAVRPLADKTMRRIARGVDKFTLKSGKPYICMTNNENARGSAPDQPIGTITTDGHQMLIVPSLIQYHGEQKEYTRGQTMERPLLTVDAANRYGLTSAQLIKYYGQGVGQDIVEPAHTITTKDRGALVLAHITKFKGDNLGQPPTWPLQTVTTAIGQFGVVKTRIAKATPEADLGYWPKVRALLNRYCGYTMADDEILLLEIGGAWWFIYDIGLRMLMPRELFNAQGFLSDYVIDIGADGRSYPKTEQVARCGNAVCPPLAEALVRANLPGAAAPCRFASVKQLYAYMAV